MAVLLALYPQPDDVEKFESYYWSHHIPLVRNMPDIQSVEVSKGSITGIDPHYYLVARLTWESMALMESSLNSPVGKLASEDVKKFAPKGSRVLLFDTASI